MSNDMEGLKRVYDGIRELGGLGTLATVRRAMSIVANELNAVAGSEIRPLCNEPGPTSGLNTLGFQAAYAEIRSEDRRKTLFADPMEHITATLVDFYSGRLDAFEIRKFDRINDELIAKATARAQALLRQNFPLVQVTVAAEDDLSEVVEALRTLAYRLEKSAPGRTVKSPTMSPLASESCSLISVEAGARRWQSNGTELVQQFRDVYQCMPADACCSNQAYVKYGDWREQVVWRDEGNSANPPPANPPPFQEYPWVNRCPVFPTPVAGVVSSDWGWRTIDGSLDFHPGMDIAVPVGTQVLNTVQGTIVHINRSSPGGQTGVIVRSGDEIRQYWHVDPDANISIGDNVRVGTVLGVTANYPRPHLHFGRFRPPGGDWTRKSDANSLNPCP